MATSNVLPQLLFGTQDRDSTSSLGQQITRPRPGASRTHAAGGGNSGKGGRREGHGRAEREQKRARKPEIDPARYRRTTLHNTCTDMLEDGFHQSFAELFTLVEQQRLQHERAGPAAILLEPLIEGDATKLGQLKAQLSVAEEGRRRGDLNTVYMAYRALAQYFEKSRDVWLSDHFYNRCLETGVLIRGDNRRKEGEAHCHVGLALENRGDLDKASAHMAVFRELSQKHRWHTDSGDSLYEIACEHLRRIYTSLAERDENAQSGISYLHKALEMAKESGDSYQEGVACYRLGNAHQHIGEYDKAIQYHKGYLERCKYHTDEEGVGNAYEALAKAHESKGEINDAVKYLELYVNIAEKAGLQTSLAKACSAIGTMCNALGDYEKAVEYYGRTYTISSESSDTDAQYLARVHVGIAKGHLNMESFSSRLSSDSMHQLLSWKHRRTESDSEEEDEEEDEKEEEEEEEEEEAEEEEEGKAEGAAEDEQYDKTVTTQENTLSDVPGADGKDKET